MRHGGFVAAGQQHKQGGKKGGDSWGSGEAKRPLQNIAAVVQVELLQEEEIIFCAAAADIHRPNQGGRWMAQGRRWNRKFTSPRDSTLASSRRQSLTNRSRGFCDVAASGSGGVRGAERGTLGCARASSCCDIHKYQRGKCRGGAAQTQPPTSDRNESFIWKAFTKIRERVSILFQKNFGSRFGEQEGAIHTFHPICAS